MTDTHLFVKEKLIDYSFSDKELKKDFFAGFTSLEKIIIHGPEKIKNIDDGAFDSVSSSLKELEIIYCNRLESFPSNLLFNLSNLKKLTIHLNGNLKGFPTNFFEIKNNNLESIRISHNSKIVDINCSLKGCVNLNYLDISFNSRLKNISCDFISSPSLEELVLRQPKLNVQCVDAINILKKIPVVVCYENLLKKIDTKESVQKMKFLKDCVESIKKLEWAKGYDLYDEEVLKELTEDNYFRKGTIYEATEREMKNAVMLYNI